LLAGIDFFRKAVRFQEKYRPPGVEIVNGIQTNGTLINRDWCTFLSENRFRVGISLDGAEELHNAHRRYRSEKGSFGDVIKGYYLLREFNIDTEALCVINSENVLYPLQVYSFFLTLGFSYITFIPHIGPGANVDPEEFGAFLITVFEQWKKNDIGRIRVQIFEEALRPSLNQEHTLCIFKKECGRVPVVEQNGDFYSCDHFVTADNLIGNISEQSIKEMLSSTEQKRFGKDKFATLPDYCLQCEVLNMCNGGCPGNRFAATPDGKPGLNYLCKGYRMFFNHIRPFADTLSRITGE
jgi:uncharacterized protein